MFCYIYMKTNWFMTTDMENMAGTNYNKTFLIWLLQKKLTNITDISFELNIKIPILSFLTQQNIINCSFARQ